MKLYGADTPDGFLPILSTTSTYTDNIMPMPEGTAGLRASKVRR